MVSFELNVADRKMIVHGDDSLIGINQFNVCGNATQWCINYLKGYMYRSVSQLVSSRRNVYEHVQNANEKIQICDNLFQLNEIAYNSVNWIDRYWDMIDYKLVQICPNADSRYFENFCKKKHELLDKLSFLRMDKKLFWESNLVKQGRLNLV